MKKKKYLPVGSVVLLNNGKKPVVIMGYKMVSSNQHVYKNKEIVANNSVYDYSGVVYPEGMISSDVFCMFNHENINKVLFEGYVTDESNKWSEFLKEND